VAGCTRDELLVPRRPARLEPFTDALLVVRYDILSGRAFVGSWRGLAFECPSGCIHFLLGLSTRLPRAYE
jgi:hypothetical protein